MLTQNGAGFKYSKKEEGGIRKGRNTGLVATSREDQEEWEKKEGTWVDTIEWP